MEVELDIDVYMSNIKTAKYHNAFVDMRVGTVWYLFYNLIPRILKYFS